MDQWLHQWNYYDYNRPRKNNHVEGWHSRLKRIVGKPHPNIFEIMDVIKREQAATEMKLEQYAAGATGYVVYNIYGATQPP